MHTYLQENKALRRILKRVRPLLRQGISDDGLKNAILEAIAIKPEKHEFRDKPGQVVRLMSMTGG